MKQQNHNDTYFISFIAHYLAFLFIFLVVVFAARGDSVPVSFYVLKGQGGLQKNKEVSFVIKQAKRHYYDAGIDLKVAKVQVNKGYYNKPPQLDDMFGEYNKVQAFIWRTQKPVYGSIGHAIIPPFRKRKDSWMTGVAYTNSYVNRYRTKSSISLSTAKPELPFASANIISHEIGHTLGAPHDDSDCNLMNSASLSCGYQFGQKFNDGSIKRIKSTLSNTVYEW